jgi:membrane protein DedA with SNARE-associated domain
MEYVAFVLAGALAGMVTRRMHVAWGMLGALGVVLAGLTAPLAALFALTSPAAVDDAMRTHVGAAHVAAMVVMSYLLWRARRRSRR